MLTWLRGLFSKDTTPNQWKRYRGVMALRSDHWRTLDLRGLK